MEMICPKCSTSWPGSCVTCPKDGSQLFKPDDESEDDMDLLVEKGTPSELPSPSDFGIDSRQHGEKKYKDPEVGGILGRYRLLERIGQGGMGIVFRAEHELLNRQVAIKVLSSEFSNVPELAHRFFKEAQAVNQLQHPNLITVTDFVEGNGNPPYMVMEFLQGRDLSDLIRKEGRLSTLEAVRIAMTICNVMAAIHDISIVHRDLKSENIFLETGIGNIPKVKLLDFGIAKFLVSEEEVCEEGVYEEVDSEERIEKNGPAGKNAQNLRNEHRVRKKTQVGRIVGTPEYMAPEQLEGKEIDHRVDIYALGIILYESLTGKLPFKRTLSDISCREKGETSPLFSELLDGNGKKITDIPEDLKQVVRKCLAKTPDDRYQTMKELSTALSPFGPENFFIGDEWATHRIPGKPMLDKTGEFEDKIDVRVLAGSENAASKRPGLTTLLGAATLIIAVVFGFWFFSRGDDQETSHKNTVVQQDSVETPRPGPGKVLITSVPEGASIYKLPDGELIGQTPSFVTVSAGERTRLRLALENHEDTTIDVESSAGKPVKVKMKKALAQEARGGETIDGEASQNDMDFEEKQPARGKKRRGKDGKRSPGRRKGSERLSDTIDPFEQ